MLTSPVVRVYGFHPVREALRRESGKVRRVRVAAGRGGGRRREVEALCRRAGVPCEEIARERLDELSGGAPHNGFLAELAGGGNRGEESVEGGGTGSGRGPGAEGAGGMAEPAAGPGPGAGGDPELLVLVEDVQDPRNLGALIRVCEAAGAGRLLIRDRGSAPLSPAAVKTSAGAAEWLPIERVTNSADTIRRLKDDGFWVYGAAAGAGPAWETDLRGKVLLVFGGEEKGLRRLTRELCDGLVGLPMRGRVESLNLSTAAAAVLYEAVRQRTSAAGGSSTAGESGGRGPGKLAPAGRP